MATCSEELWGRARPNNFHLALPALRAVCLLALASRKGTFKFTRNQGPLRPARAPPVDTPDQKFDKTPWAKSNGAFLCRLVGESAWTEKLDSTSI